MLKDHLRQEGARLVVTPPALKARPIDGGKLSLTIRDAELSSPRGVLAYRERKIATLRDGKRIRPGVYVLRQADFEAVGLQPCYSEDPDDEPYGDLHYLVDEPTKEDRIRLAKHATDNGESFPIEVLD